MLIVLYFIFMLIIGGRAYKQIKNHKDFFIAGKRGSVLEITGSLLATILGSSTIIGSVDFAYDVGWAGAWLLLAAILGLILLYPFLEYLEKFQNYNLSELLGNIYGKEVKLLASFIIPIAWLGIIASQIIGAAKIVMILSSLEYIEAVIISGGIFIIYTFLGGQLSIIKTDFIQLGFIIFGIGLTYLYINSGVNDMESLGLINEKFNFLDVLVLILTYSTTFLVGPDIYSRLFCAKDIKVMKTSLIMTIIILIPLAFILSWLGIYGKTVFTQTEFGLKSILLLIAENKLPKEIQIFLYFGLLSAVISSADTTLLTASSLLTQCFLKDLKNKKAIKLTRFMIIFLGVMAICISLYLKNILSGLLLATAIYSGAFIIPTIFGVLGYKGESKLVVLGIISGGILAFIGKVISGDNGNYIIIMSFILNIIMLLLGRLFLNKKRVCN